MVLVARSPESGRIPVLTMLVSGDRSRNNRNFPSGDQSTGPLRLSPVEASSSFSPAEPLDIFSYKL